MRKHFNEFLVLIHGCQKKIGLIILTEINIKQEEVSIYTIDGYDMHWNTRETSKGGGILIYTKKEINFSSINITGNSGEYIHGQIGMENQRDIHIITAYRPPKTNKLCFINEIHQLLKTIPTNCDAIVIGDTNIDLIGNTNRAMEHYKNTLYQHGLQCTITDVTREEIVKGRVVRSCIDHLWVRSQRPVAESLLLTCKVSDHYLIGLRIEVTDPTDGQTSDKNKNSEKYIVSNKLVREKLNSVQWSEFSECQNPAILYEKLCCVFSDIYASSQLVCKNNSIRVSQKWIDKNLQKMMDYRDNLFRKWKSNPNNVNNRLDYTRFRNKVNKCINKAKNIYRQTVIRNCQNDCRKIWVNINNWLGRTKTNLDSVIEKYLGKTERMEHICTNFSKTFTEEIHNIKHKCNKKFLKRSDYVNEALVSMNFKKVSACEIEKIIDQLKCETSPGSDEIRVQDIKYIKKEISPIIANFINMSVSSGQYPDDLKLSLIRPIYKQGCHLDYTNYRPIAILSVINKITEKVIVRQICNFLEKHSIISNSQHGFRRGRSTATALTQFTDYINNNLNDRKQLVAVFIDFKKAFDTLDHDQLIQAMNECGIRGPLNVWLKSYLHNRKLRTVISGKKGDKADIVYGVPTGSVYGPVGYIMHVNSMCNVIKHGRMYMYADDTCLLYAHKDLQRLQSLIQADIDNIIKWAHDNGIIINLTKTKCVHIRSPYNKLKDESIKIVGHNYDCMHSGGRTCNCCLVEFVEQYKYLGLIIDRDMSWKSHVNAVCGRLRSALGKFYHLNRVVTRATLYTVYYALVDAIIDYGLSCYGCTFPSYLDKIKTLQIRILKTLVDKNTKHNCKSNYEQLFGICKILPIHEKVKMLIVLENYNNDSHKKHIDHKITTRKISDKKFIVPNKNNYYGERTRMVLVPSIYNDLPVSLRCMNNVTKKTFKKHVNNHLLKMFMSKM